MVDISNDRTRDMERQLADVIERLTEPVDSWAARKFRDMPSEEADVQDLAPLLREPNVVGLGVSEKSSQGEMTGSLAFTIYVREKREPDQLQTSEMAPRSVVLPDGKVAPTDVVELGEIWLEGSSVRAGGSIRASGGPGTLAAIVRGMGRLSILSNRHVLSLPGTLGQVVNSPAGGPAVGHVDRLVDLVPGIDFVNDVDAGLASVVPERSGDLDLDTPFGPPDASVEPRVGMEVGKLGAQTGMTTSVILDAHFYVRVDYPGLGPVGFRDQIQSRKFTTGGDSGSIVWDMDTKAAIGLHFAGTTDRSIANRIQLALAELGVGFASKG